MATPVRTNYKPTYSRAHGIEADFLMACRSKGVRNCLTGIVGVVGDKGARTEGKLVGYNNKFFLF